jgi:hypothetical protein
MGPAWHDLRTGRESYPFSVLTPAELEEQLALGHETRGFEIKGPGRSDEPHFLAKIARAALSLGNLRDGGHIVIGISDDAPSAMQPGLDDDRLDTWDPDTAISRLAPYADPPLRLEVVPLKLSNSVRVIVVKVHEFDDVPHLCAQAFPENSKDKVLIKGRLYVRSRRIPETVEIADSSQMREVLDIATAKALRRFLATAREAGVDLEELAGSAAARAFQADRDAAW